VFHLLGYMEKPLSEGQSGVLDRDLVIWEWEGVLVGGGWRVAVEARSWGRGRGTRRRGERGGESGLQNRVLQ